MGEGGEGRERVPSHMGKSGRKTKRRGSRTKGLKPRTGEGSGDSNGRKDEENRKEEADEARGKRSRCWVRSQKSAGGGGKRNVKPRRGKKT